MSLINIISAAGNNSSVYPLLVRDCGIENPVKIALTYNQNLKDSKQIANNALRERIIDEYGTSAVWIFSIPIIDKLADKIIKKMGYDPSVNIKLFKENEKQGVKFNIEKFKNIAPKESGSLEKIFNNKSTYQKLLAGKFLLSTAIPISLMGYFLPKFNFALTSKLKKKQDVINPIVDKTYKAQELFEKGSENNNLSFRGVASYISNMSHVEKMAVTDGGLTIGRVGTARNKYEAMENGFKMSVMMFLNYLAPRWIEKGLDKLSSKLFNTNVNLDPMLLNNKEFMKSIKEDRFEIPKSNFIDYFDKNPKSQFSSLCAKYCDVKFLENGVRDPRKFVDESKVQRFADELNNFIKDAKASNNIDKFSKKALYVKSANILANITISSVLLAIALPKLTFILRKIVTGSEAEPGLLQK